MVDLTSVLQKLEKGVEQGEALQLTPFETAVLHEFLSDILLIDQQFTGFDDTFFLTE